jgi:hypothetical protein
LLVGLVLLCSAHWSEAGTHSAAAGFFFYDPIDVQYSGTSNPPGPPSVQINLANGQPGYLNAISGGANGGASGYVFATHFPNVVTTYILGIAVHVTDTTGASHSLSALNDPALNDIVTDINASGNQFFCSVVAYPYNSAPSQYSTAEAVLSAGESANGGPFDLLITATDTGSTGSALDIWEPSFTNEINNLDGITAINVTDLGLVPEPSSAAVFGLAAFAMLVRRRCWN